jgi:hypothetical protein
MVQYIIDRPTHDSHAPIEIKASPPDILRLQIENLPDIAFTRNLFQRRNALINKIEALINSHINTTGFDRKIKNDIEQKILDWISDEYQEEVLMTLRNIE